MLTRRHFSLIQNIIFFFHIKYAKKTKQASVKSVRTIIKITAWTCCYHLKQGKYHIPTSFSSLLIGCTAVRRPLLCVVFFVVSSSSYLLMKMKELDRLKKKKKKINLHIALIPCVFNYGGHKTRGRPF